MELSKVHEIGDGINGETHILFCSVTVKNHEIFLQENVKTKKIYDRREWLGRNVHPKIGKKQPSFTYIVIKIGPGQV